MRDPATGMSMGLSDLPPGVSDRDIDRAAGGGCIGLCRVCEAPVGDAPDLCEAHEGEAVARLMRAHRRRWAREEQCEAELG